MSIEEIKSIKKLHEMLKSEIAENKKLKEHCEKAGHCKAQMSIMGTDTNKCKCFPNCYYKQLKRKEQECETLKQKLHQCWTVENSFAEQLDQLEAENKKLKQALAEIKELAEKDIDFCTKCNSDKNIDCVACIEGGRALFAKDILKIISECEVQNDR